ncbi:MAG TPA: OmpA family protein [Steroidobacteraceae bacterium]|nr:OmpA family protein [Steroidobacteraceae bacterium]
MITRNARYLRYGLAAVACLTGAPVWADAAAAPDSNAKAEDIGIFTGLAVGAAAGGPIGAVIGAAAGGLMGDRYHREKQTARELKSDLGKSEAERARLEHTLAAVDAVGMDVSFRTDDSSIKVEDMGPLLKLGALAAAVPDAQLRVAGFADPRGDAAYNEALSQQRAEAVAAALVCGGMARERLIIEAHGASESTSAAGDLDAFALDRRVTVRLERATPTPPAKVASSGGLVPGTGP